MAAQAKTDKKLDKNTPAEKPKVEEPIRGWVADWAYNILILLFGTTLLIQAFVVPSSSMEGTILIGDHLFVDKLAYSPSGPISRYLLPYTEPKRGDIIVFRYPMDIRFNYVKRLIGLPGDHIKIVSRQLYINGKPVNEYYKQHIRNGNDSYLDNFPSQPGFPVYPPALEMLEKNVVNGELVVPPGSYFAMGDNRDNSADSRFWGFVPRENIVGKPLFIFWSFDAPTDQWTDMSIGHIFDVAINFFGKTRWNRTFMFVRSVPIGY